jgi:hypothetical protein
MREHVCETNNPPVKSLITDRYVPWYCDIDNQRTEWEPYAIGLGSFTLPLICRIDPHNPNVYIDRSTNEQDTATFYSRLQGGIDDWDSDGMPDEWERQYGLNAMVNDAQQDADEDGLKNISEYNAQTHPNDADTDDDGMPDGWEAQYGLNPLVNDASGDLDNDRFTNLKEYQEGTLPNDRRSRPERAMPWLPLLLDEN